MFRHHKLRLKAVREAKKRNVNKDPQDSRVGGTGLRSLAFWEAQYQHDRLQNPFLPERSLATATLGAHVPVPMESQVHDRTRWPSSKTQTRLRLAERDASNDGNF